jgi:alpha-tubulin suppressor-like RCC1 family protein
LYAGYYTAFVKFSNGEIWSFGDGSLGQMGVGSVRFREKQMLKVNFDPKTKNMASGEYHTAAIDSQGHAYTWGSGTYGKLGNKLDIEVVTPSMV